MEVNKVNLAKDIRDYADSIESELIRIRRELHQYPEVGKDLPITHKIIVENLRKIPGMEVIPGLARGSGCMGILRGALPGPCILLRADIDALPVTEDNDLSFRSKHQGAMHACGHDAHATWVLGAAMIMSHFIDCLAGSVRFLFQPGEECGYGAREMIEEDHVLENPRVDYALAAHGWPSIDAGKIGIARRYAFGCPGGFHFKIKGKGGHGSWPYQAVNPVTIASQIACTLPQIVSERINSLEPRVLSVCSIHGGKTGVGNIIPDECDVWGTFRATKYEIMEQMVAEMEKVIKGSCMMQDAAYTFDYHFGHPVKNDPELLQPVLAMAGEIMGQDQVYIIEEDHLGGENFSEFSRRVPSIYLFIGIRNLNKWEEFSLHSGNYMLEESVLADAAACFANIAFKLGQGRMGQQDLL